MTADTIIAVLSTAQNQTDWLTLQDEVLTTMLQEVIMTAKAKEEGVYITDDQFLKLVRSMNDVWNEAVSKNLARQRPAWAMIFRDQFEVCVIRKMEELKRQKPAAVQKERSEHVRAGDA